jgi:hypothetical protein
MEQLFIILIAVVIGLLKYLAKRSDQPPDNSRPNRPASRPAGSARPETEDEAMKKFFEALGIPKGGYPPQSPGPISTRGPSLGRSVIAKKAPAPIQKELPKAIPTTPPRPPAAVPDTLPGGISDAYWQKPPAESTAVPADAAANVRALLTSPASVRSAVILREILGPPRSLQPW